MNRVVVAIAVCLSLSGVAATADAAGGRPSGKERKKSVSRATSGEVERRVRPLAAVVPDGPPNDRRPVHPVRTRPLREIPPLAPPRRGEPHYERLPEPIRPPRPVDTGEPDSARQPFFGAAVSAPAAAGVSFEGVGSGIPGFTPVSNPPDVNGHVGATQYVQWNNTSFAIWDKSGTLLYGPAAGNTLFQSLGGPCATHNDGDPIVNYDVLSGRWILSQFVVGASPDFSHQCFAVSATGDATGAYSLYDFVVDSVNFVDYPHIGVWPDGYYMTSHVFNGAGTAYVASRVYVFERDKMLLGQSARMVSADLPKVAGNFQYGFLPADLDSLTPPPAGEAEFIMGPHPTQLTRVVSTRASVVWGVTPSLTLSATSTITVSSPGLAPCANNTAAQENRDCVPQPAPAVGADYLDNLSDHFMYRLAYRNFGGAPAQESLVATQTGGSSAGGSHTDLRWYEFRNAGSSTSVPTLFQTGTYDPDAAWRWMASIAMDKDHNIALGYSKSSTTIIPGIYMTGRLGTDPLNTMGAETAMQAGTGVQLGGGNRWGDYSAMTLDPIDQCTFWYTNEYRTADGDFNWRTRIAAYKFPSCTPAASWGTVSGTVTSCATGAPLEGVLLTLSNGFAGSTDAAGNYSISVPPGLYALSASDSGRNCTSSSPSSADVNVTSGGNAAQNFCMTGGSNLEYASLVLNDYTNGNDNGVVNANECVNLTVALWNDGCANETAISATMTTSTAGVTVTQATSSYPDMAIDSGGTNATPFRIQTSNAFVCGTPVNLTLNLTYAGGSKALGVSLPTCGGGANQSIPTSSIALTDPSQTDRLGRDGVPSTCQGKTCPGGIGTAGTRNYRTYAFSNPASVTACMTVTINAACGSGGSAGDIESAAYLTSYNPSSLCNNYLGDSGVTGLGTPAVPSASYSFNVPALSNFVVVVNTNAGGATCAQFSGTVAGFLDLTQGPGGCPTCVPPAPPTPSISAGGATTICDGASVTLTSSAASGNQWYRNGSRIAGATGTSYNAATSGSYTVTTTVSGCVSAQSAATTVTVKPVPATPAASNTGPYCPGATIALFTPAVTGASYSWTGPNGFSSSQQSPSRANATAADAGTYFVTVTVDGCPSSAGSTTVVVNPAPPTPAITPGGPTTFCAGGSVVLTSSSATGNQWSLDGTPISGATNPTYNATASGNYTVVVTASGCASAPSSATIVTVNPAPPAPSITPGGPTTFCAGGSVLLTSSSGSGNQWSLDGTPIGGATNPTFTATASGNYTVVVTANGCSSAPSPATTVTVHPIPPAPTITPGGPTTFCAGGSVLLTSSSSSGNQWYLDGAVLAGETGQTLVAVAAGRYTVSATASGCTGSVGQGIEVVVRPKPAFTISFASPMFLGAFAAASVDHECPGATFAWSASGGTILSGNGTRGITFSADATGTLTITVTVTNAYGCSETKTADVTVQQAPFGAPPFFRASATGTATASLSWARVALADHYEIERSPDRITWTPRGTSTTASFSETGLTPSTTWFFRVRAIKADSTASAFSALDPATTIVITDPSLLGCTLISVVHVTELRAMVNAARASTGLGAFAFTDPTLAAGSVIRAVHVTELRTALSGFLSALGITPAYTDPTLAAGTTVVKAAHLQELRDLIR